MDKENIKIDYVVHESALARMERINKRLFSLLIAVFAALIITNMGWIYYENQFEDVVTTVSQDAISDGGNAIIHGDHAGAVIYGESKADSNN